jgi:hypothetical protein
VLLALPGMMLLFKVAPWNENGPVPGEPAGNNAGRP